MAPHRKRFYAWRVGDEEGVTTSWPECEAKVKGRNARYKRFSTLEEALAWLRDGAKYGPWDDGVRPLRLTKEGGAGRARPNRRPKAQHRTPTIGPPLPRDAIYFDSGTGRGQGIEVNVTTWDRKPVAHLLVSGERITPYGTIQLSKGRTNNYGELLACLLAIRAARRLGFKKVGGDSRLVLDYWSKGHVKRPLTRADPDLARLVEMTKAERAAFEAEGGVLHHVRGSLNPADLGFHSRR